jgi:hypothetical protein
MPRLDSAQFYSRFIFKLPQRLSCNANGVGAGGRANDFSGRAVLDVIDRTSMNQTRHDRYWCWSVRVWQVPHSVYSSVYKQPLHGTKKGLAFPQVLVFTKVAPEGFEPTTSRL